MAQLINPGNEMAQLANDRDFQLRMIAGIMRQLGVTEVNVTLQTVLALSVQAEEDGCTVVLFEGVGDEAIKVRLVSLAEAKAIARRAGGLPQ